MSFIDFDFDFDLSDENAEKRLGIVKKTYEVDERFFKLKRNSDGVGTAVIRFLPDAEGNLFTQMYRYDVTNIRGEEKRWVSEWSPQTINKPDPFQEEWKRLWNSGHKEESKQFTRRVRYLANIYVIFDKQNPENEGKYFVLDLNSQLYEKIIDILKGNPEIGEDPIQLFNPIKGNNFTLILKNDTNRIPTYSYSKPASTQTALWNTKEEAIKNIKENTYLLSKFKEPDFFKSYEELKEKFDYVTFANVEDEKEVVDTKDPTSMKIDLEAFEDDVKPTESEKEEVQETKPIKKTKKTKSENIEDILNDLN